jgi:predicted neuraminidase
MAKKVRSGRWIATLIAALVTGLVCGARCVGQVMKADGVVRPGRSPDTVEAYLPVIAKSNHAANLLSLPNGDLLCFWFAGPEEGESGVSIVLSRLDHGSHQWSQPEILARHLGWSDQNPVPFRAPDGRLWLFHTSQEAGKGQTTATVYELTSNDEGHTWSAPRVLFAEPGTFIRQPLVVFQDAWLFPTYRSASAGITTNAEHDVSIVKISHDKGKTWSACPVPDSGGLVQMNIIPMGRDRLTAFFRSRFADWIYRSDSADGCHWSAPAATQLPNNNASIQATRLQDGHLVMVFNNAQAGVTREEPRTAARRVLSVALSLDGGKTWPRVRDLENGETAPPLRPGEDAEYSYPSVTQLPDGRIAVAYTFRREAIKMLTFAEAWIQQGSTQGVFSGDRSGTDH